MSLIDALQAADTEEEYDAYWGGKDYRRALPWSHFARQGIFMIGGHEFEVVDSDISLNQDEGEQSEVFVIFKSRLDSGEVFKKTGYANSYTDEHYWDGPIVQVRPVEKTIIEWEEA